MWNQTATCPSYWKIHDQESFEYSNHSSSVLCLSVCLSVINEDCGPVGSIQLLVK